MNINPVSISKLQQLVSRFQMWRAALSLRNDYNDLSLQEFNALDADEFLEDYQQFTKDFEARQLTCPVGAA